MSLINEALKKAQHQRTGDPAELPPMPGASPGPGGVRRGKPEFSQGLVLAVAGGAVAVVLAIVATVYFVSRPSGAKPAPAKVAAAAPAPAPAQAPAVAVRTPVDTTPPPVIKLDLSREKLPAADAATLDPTAAKSEPAPEPVSAPTAAPVPVTAAVARVDEPPPKGITAGSAPAPVNTPPASTTALAPVVSAPAAAPTTEPAVSQDVRIGTFVDSIRVTGIRSSGGSSKVLMNDKVYRLNDVVDRTLGLRLIKIEPDGLTFADAKGTTYVKNF